MRTPLTIRSIFSVLCAAAIGSAFLIFAVGETRGESKEEYFEKRVRPLLIQECLDCHSEEEPESKLELDSLAGMLKGGLRGPAIVPGKAEQSLLIRAVRHGELVKMPPKRKLSPAEIVVLAKWIQDGAVWPNAKSTSPAASTDPHGPRTYTAEEKSFWAFQPIRRPAPPSVARKSWLRTPVDAFVLAKLEAANQSPAPRAERRVLLRRLYFDLTGLPPTPNQVDAFINDASPLAVERVLDQLLSSVAYGERWGRHWLDVARYADSNGMDENLAHANAFRYRDYVIQAFNADLPFDQFVREQVAGDLLPASADRPFDGIIATGFLTLGPKMLAEDDPVKMQMDIIDEQVDTLGRAVLGMTLGCARCHDHKFDPFSQGDYYALAGVFKSTHTMDTHTVVAKWHEKPLAEPQAIAAQEDHRRRVSQKAAEIKDVDDQAAARVMTEARSHLGDYLLSVERQRQLRVLRDAAESVGAQQDAASRAGVYLLEAESFARSNVGVHTTGYGEGIGVLVNVGPTPNFAEYEIDVPETATYQFEVRLAAAAARPCSLIINGQVVQTDFARSVTGSWYPDTQKWEIAGFHTLRRGKNTLRIEQPKFFPHIDKLCISPAAAKPLLDRRLDADYVPILGYVEQLAGVIEKAEPGAPLREWRDAVSGNASPDELVAIATKLQELANEAAAKDGSSQALQQLLAAADGPLRRHASTIGGYSQQEKDHLAKLRAEEKKLKESEPKLPTAMSVRESEQVGDLALHYRGSHLTLGPLVPRGFPRILAASPQPIKAGSGRQELAHWLGSSDNPLTARVFVNRVWRWHFGAGLVRTPDNFGSLGDRPTHPQLLDFLAAEFVDSGWSVKHLHRLILQSATYQQAAKVKRGDNGEFQSFGDDPENLLWGRMNRRRLEAEAIRDSILAVTSSLDRRMGGRTLPTANRAYVTSTANVNPDIYRIDRRSVYLPIVRSALFEVLQAFDFADPSAIQGGRQSTTIAPQALFMLNSELVAKKTLAWSQRLLADAELDDAGRIDSIYRHALSRHPTQAEQTQAQNYLRHFAKQWGKEHPDADVAAARQRAWQSFARAILSTNEFIYLE